MIVKFFPYTTLWTASPGVVVTPEMEERRTQAVRIVVPKSLSKSDILALAEAAAGFFRVRLVVDSQHEEVWKHLHRFGSVVGIQTERLPGESANFDFIPSTVTELSIGLVGRLDAVGTRLLRFSGLRRLIVSGDLPNLDFIEGLADLEYLSLQASKLDFGHSSAFARLLRLRLQHGSVNLPPTKGSFPALQSLEIWKTRGLTDLDWIAGSPELQELILGALPHVQTLPSLEHHRRLECITLEQMKGLKTIKQIALSPSVRRVHVKEMNQLPMSDYQALAGHPTLRELSSGYTSQAKRKAVNDCVGLPPVHYEVLHDMVEF